MVSARGSAGGRERRGGLVGELGYGQPGPGIDDRGCRDVGCIPADDPQYSATSYVIAVPDEKSDPSAALGFAQAYGRV
ncbi:hypothetical protein ACWCOW_41785, partial [Streptomyces sp. NPDC001939]